MPCCHRGGDVKRALYTDDELSGVQFLRAVILTGIDMGALNGDITDRLVPLDLRAMAKILSEENLKKSWNIDRTGHSGGLLTRRCGACRAADARRDNAAENGGLRPRACLRRQHHGQRRHEPLPAAATAVDGGQRDKRLICRAADQIHYETAKGGETAATILLNVQRTLKLSTPVDWPLKARTVTTILRKNRPAMRGMRWTVTNDDGRNAAGTIKWNIKPPNDIEDVDQTGGAEDAEVTGDTG